MPVLASALCPEFVCKSCNLLTAHRADLLNFDVVFLGAIDFGADADALVFFRVVVFFVVSVIRLYLLDWGPGEQVLVRGALNLQPARLRYCSNSAT